MLLTPRTDLLVEFNVADVVDNTRSAMENGGTYREQGSLKNKIVRRRGSLVSYHC